VDGELVNTVGAIWTLDKRDVTDTQYEEFYRFLSGSYDKPKYRLHFKTDAPLDLKCLFFVPSFHTEKFGMGR
jgi:HSP90 family molecular chaperone